MKLNKANQIRRNIEARIVCEMLRERNRSGANGTHADRRNRRLRTRQAVKNQALKDWV